MLTDSHASNASPVRPALPASDAPQTPQSVKSTANYKVHAPRFVINYLLLLTAHIPDRLCICHHRTSLKILLWSLLRVLWCHRRHPLGKGEASLQILTWTHAFLEMLIVLLIGPVQQAKETWPRNSSMMMRPMKTTVAAAGVRPLLIGKGALSMSLF